MHPPAYVCKALFQLHPQLRLGWAGRERQHKDELNPGSFALIQLYHNRDCGSYDFPTTYREFWDVTPRLDAHGALMNVVSNRGPIFNRWGGGHRDWDPLMRKPIFVTELDPWSVLSGQFIHDIRGWMTSIVDRVVDSARERGRNLKRRTQDISGQMTDHLWHLANKTDSAYNPVAWKHMRDEVYQLNAQSEQSGANAPIEDYYMPSKPPPKAK